MKKKINIQLCIVGMVSVLLTAILTGIVFYNVFEKQVFSDLEVYTKLLSQSNLIQDTLTGEENFSAGDVRITLIQQDGMVLYDNTTDASTMNNHSNRPEVQDAMSTGTGKSIRQSDTIGANTFYYAMHLDNGNVIRTAKESKSIASIFIGLIPAMLFIIVIMFVVCLILAQILTKRIIKPIEVMAENVEHMEENSVFEELVPFARTIKHQHDDIKQHVRELKQEHAKIDLITRQMEEGLLLVDENRNVLIANKSALRLLNCKQRDVKGKNILYVTRNEELLGCIQQGVAKEKKNIRLTIGERELQAYANPIVWEGKNLGVVCFIVDVTESVANERMRHEFTANVSHELKTPLASISGYAELIESGIAKPEDVRTFATNIHNSANRLLQLINDIMRLSQLDESGFEVEKTSIDLYEVANRCKEHLGMTASKRNVTLVVEGERAYIEGNELMLEELVFNLMDNAIRYNKQDGEVLVTIAHEKEHVVLSVKDGGIGIPPQYQERIFERFFRVDKSRSTATGGTGLGLAIVKHAAKWHNASIRVDSMEGVGTTISVVFEEKI